MIDEKKLSAKEMFEALGWEQVTNEESYIVYQRGRRMISFIRNGTDGIVACSCHLNMDWLKAVNKQCQELGWI